MKNFDVKLTIVVQELDYQVVLVSGTGWDFDTPPPLPSQSLAKKEGFVSLSETLDVALEYIKSQVPDEEGVTLSIHINTCILVDDKKAVLDQVTSLIDAEDDKITVIEDVDFSDGMFGFEDKDDEYGPN